MEIKAWIEAMRLRTLPVSVAGVIAGIAMAIMYGGGKFAPAAICLVFAVLCQVSSNFANEYYDFKAGLDKPGREGPRRGVTEGDITPKAMKAATYITLGLACGCGLSLVHWGGWWLIGVGAAIALGAVAYSAGPYPLSRHGLGEAAVTLFFGVIPVNFTFYLQTGYFTLTTALASISIGLMGANVLIVNNYRDMEDDAAVGKRTLAVKWGRRTIGTIYLLNGYLAVALMFRAWMATTPAWATVPVLYLVAHTGAWLAITHLRGRKLNPFLGITAMLMLLYSLGMLAAFASM
ncbi:MAG: 1,4-dihydroxy-2-naphthoate octaprenyltransferase [Clostridium sp.]|nr:1,4-dihydroxy-2-naphthoate octaprenyltransferase [Clostridium sp.]